MLFDPNDGDVYVANTDSQGISVIQGSTDKVVQTISTVEFTWRLALNSQTGVIYASCGQTANQIYEVTPGATSSTTTTTTTTSSTTTTTSSSSSSHTTLSMSYLVVVGTMGSAILIVLFVPGRRTRPLSKTPS